MNDSSGAVVGRYLLACLLFAGGIGSARAEDPPYNEKLLRLAEVLGSVHFLRNLCGETTNQWRDAMNDLVVSENPTPERKAKIIASFNHGYRSYGGIYLRCTQAATTALDQFMSEGKALSEEIAQRYAN
jgi:uncharacterized protein (TIGR02301 family)